MLSEMHLETLGSPSCDGLYQSTYPIAGEFPPLVVWHRLGTVLDAVGCQIWRGAALLADYVLANAADFKGATVVELGSGPGLGALAAARAGAATVFATDRAGDGVLDLCQRNAVENRLEDVVRVRELDWTATPEWLGGGGAGPPASGPFSWTAEDIDAIKSGAGPLHVLAADTVYDNTLTEAFMAAAEELVCGAASRPAPRLVVALERRECFTLRDLDVTAPAYDYWRTLFGEGRPLGGRRVAAASVPQRLQGYARSDALELWVLEINSKSSVK